MICVVFMGRPHKTQHYSDAGAGILLVCLRLHSNEDAEHFLHLLNPSHYELNIFLHAVIYILELCGFGLLLLLFYHQGDEPLCRAHESD